MISSGFNIPTTVTTQVSAAVSPSPTDRPTVVLRGSFRLPSVKTASITGNAPLTIGGGFRLPSIKTVPVVTKSPLTIGGGFRMTKAK